MPAPRFGRDKEKFRQPFQRLRLVRRSLTALPGAAEKEKQGSARTALVPGGHRSALTEPAGETAQRIGRGPGAEAPYLSFPQSIAPGAGTVAPCLLFPQAKLRSLGQNNRGTYVPPFFVYGKAVASPPHPCKVLGFHPKPHKPFEKGLCENFTFLHPTQARGRYVPVGRCPAADRAGRRDKG